MDAAQLLDTRTTLLVTLAIATLIGGVCFAFARGVRGSRAISLWGIGVSLIALGLIGVASRAVIPGFFGLVLANTALFASAVFMFRAARILRGLDGSDPLGWGIVAAGFLLFAWLYASAADAQTRIVAYSLIHGILIARVAVAFRPASGTPWLRAHTYTATMAWLSAAVMFLRALVTLAAGYEGEFPAPSVLQPVFIMVFTVFALAATLGVFWIEIETLQHRLVELATRDPLTELYNRRAFLAEFRREVARQERAGGGLSIAMLDIDHFKHINDTCGHAAGDRALQALAGTLREVIRGQDVAARYGGEEFVLLMPAAGKDEALGVAERVRAAVNAIRIKEIEPLGLTVSGGVATYGADGRSWETLVAAADKALYEAKALGRNRVVAARASGAEPVVE